ncbi:AAA family ATPase [Pseudaestuariivita rosea]|uniref:bifunctional aminoglycoside phosphotransferase/ATP-binding protein n=1 Tax=Pseudaestuariivita rosea TaxID=2763263 RepID=UPI001ABA3009|nr:bifunctional aminoglycoside phosphotransferase/ATP-binding protein [Pseudaestuariivita rosea]
MNDEARQEQTISFLEGRPDFDTRITTHCAHVFLYAGEALKIKRAVKYDYLDYSTLDLRLQMLKRELQLNAGAAPDLYHDVVPIMRGSDGLSIGGAGDPVEWVLRMDRFPPEAELDHIAKTQGIPNDLADGLGRAVADYHAAATVRPEDGADLIDEIIDELNRFFVPVANQVGPDRVSAFKNRIQGHFADVSDLLTLRTDQGQVRRCHGDLHLRNIIMWRGAPTPFDALEFSERLGTCDVLYDLAFLLMDLDHRGLPDAACHVFNAYLFYGRADLSGLAALPLFLAIRAGIRAMVDVQTAQGQDDPSKLISDAKAYLDQGLRYLQPPAPHLFAIGGLSGTGKTTLARKFAPGIGRVPGAVHIRSDLERKALMGVDPLTRLPAAAYRPQVSDQVFAIMRTKAQAALQAGHPVVLDGVYAKPQERQSVEALARELGCPFAGIWLESDLATRQTRVSRRDHDASDADAEVPRMQEDFKIGPVTWHRLDSSQSIDDLLNAARNIIRT